jgi:hypothetical protein
MLALATLQAGSITVAHDADAQINDDKIALR